MTEENKTNEVVKTENEAPKKDDVKKDKPKKALKEQSIDERSEVTDVSDKEKNIKVTETNGTTIDVNIKAPGLRQGELIDEKRNVLVRDSDDSFAMRFTTADFNEALFSIFDTPLVDGKPAGQIGWDFFEKHERDTYKYMMKEADTFLTSLS